VSGYSLRRRLLAGMAAWVALAMIATGVALAILFTIHVEEDLQTELEAGLQRIAALIEPDQPDRDLQDPLVDPRYETPFSGAYWQVKDLTNGHIQQSRSLWDFALNLPDDPPHQLFTVLGPEDQSLAVVSRRIAFESAAGSRSYRITVAWDRAFTDELIASFRRELAIALLAVGALILFGGWVLVELGLRPVNRLRAEVQKVRQGVTGRIEHSFPLELGPLLGQLNDLLSDRERSIEQARSRAADLAHALKTPLSVVTATAHRLRNGGNSADANALEDVAEEMSVRTDYQLRLARLRLRGGGQVLSASLNAAVLRTLGVLRKTEAGERIFWRIDLGAESVVDIDRYDLLELVGNLLENATKWAQSRIDVSSTQIAENAELCIADDGPGMSDAQIAALGQRGVRLDENRSGSGFGLAIAMEIAELNRGAIELGRSDLGGLLVKVRLPLSAVSTGAAETTSLPIRSADRP
jgi:signal transduction histidine kinase